MISGVAFPGAQANPYREPSEPVPDRYEAGFPDGMRVPGFGIHANNLVTVPAAKNRRNRQIPGC
jgi:hypothetical protein